MDQLAPRNANGFSTIELLFAMAILTFVLSGVVLVSFGNQQAISKSTMDEEAADQIIKLTRESLALAEKDFSALNSSEEIQDDVFTKSFSVKNFSDSVKEITSRIKWEDGRNLDREIELISLVANLDSPIGADTCSSVLTGDWSSPNIVNSETSLNELIGKSGSFMLSDIDAYKGKLYLTAARAADPLDPTNTFLPTFFTFNIEAPENPKFLDGADNAENVIAGLNAVKVAESEDKTFAYAGSDTSSNYSSCLPIDPSTGVPNYACAQVYIFNVTNPENTARKSHLKITSSPAISGAAQAASLYYKNGYLFVGLTSNGGPEFQILDVRDPVNIVSGAYTSMGDYEIGNGINALLVKGNHAYLATPNAQELQVLNISDPEFPSLSKSFADGAGNGKSVSIIEDKIYFGKTTGAGDDFFILNNNFPLEKIGGVDASSSVNGVIVRDYLAFILTNSELKIYRIDDPRNITLYGSITLPGIYQSSYEEPSMDCEGNNIYITSNNESGTGSLYVITASE